MDFNIWHSEQKNIYSHLTAKERERESFPTRWLFLKNKISGNVLDYGCGFGEDVKFLQSKGIKTIGYDKFYSKEYPDEKFDTIICNYVLNVLLPIEQTTVIMNISELLKPGGKAFFSVRRDIIYEGYRIHKIHKVKTYQCNVSLPFKSIYKNDNCEIYEFQHFNIVNKSSKCIFCSPKREILTETGKVYAIFDGYPISKGHVLVIPKKHSLNYFDLNLNEQTSLWITVNRVKNILAGRFQPDGFNIGINCNEAGGQTIFHTHIHIIPRYKGDVKYPRGGVRNLIPKKGNY